MCGSPFQATASASHTAWEGLHGMIQREPLGQISLLLSLNPRDAEGEQTGSRRHRGLRPSHSVLDATRVRCPVPQGLAGRQPERKSARLLAHAPYPHRPTASAEKKVRPFSPSTWSSLRGSWNTGKEKRVLSKPQSRQKHSRAGNCEYDCTWVLARVQ